MQSASASASQYDFLVDIFLLSYLLDGVQRQYCLDICLVTVYKRQDLM